MLRGSVAGGFPELELRARGPDFTVDARATLDWQQQSSYVYRDPGGRPTYIAHSDTSAISVTLQRGGRRAGWFRCATRPWNSMARAVERGGRARPYETCLRGEPGPALPRPGYTT